MTVRVYLPATAAGLRSWLADGIAGPAPLPGNAVTRELAIDYGRPDAADDDESLRLEALTDATLASAVLDRPSADERVAVLELEVESNDVTLQPGEGSSVLVTAAVPRAAWVAGYLGPWWLAGPDGPSSAAGRSEVTNLSGDDLSWHGVQELDEALLPPGATATGQRLPD